ncbi:MAG: aldolase/citrate lyase family protein [Burkholderiaceae bacterium]
MKHPREFLLGAQAVAGLLPVCDHFSGVEQRMRKSLALQSELTQEFGACVFDATLDCEDGAPVGGEREHAHMVTALAVEAASAYRQAFEGIAPRIAVRVHPLDHPAFEDDLCIILGGAGAQLCHLMVPKVESLREVERIVARMDAFLPTAAAGSARLPLHVLLESPAAVHAAFDIAAHPRVQSISFGLMDFVSAHAGAIPGSAMSGAGQFTHPLVLRAKLEIASACHAHGKVPSHCVVTEFNDVTAVEQAAQTAARQLGYTRMWSIHPAQIRPILAAFAPQAQEIELASRIIARARSVDWAPIDFAGQLHDRASYRFFWQILERAHRTGQALPVDSRQYFATSPY